MNYNNLNRQTQAQPILGREKEMIQNHDGNYVFKVSPMNLLERFLVLGTTSGTYYVNKQTQFNEVMPDIVKLITSNGKSVVDKVVDISVNGKAPKNDEAIFVLALCACADDKEVRKYALSNLDKVCRIGTHLFQFVDTIKHNRGMGRLIKESVNNWYLSKENDKLAYQLVKYQQRNGWSHKDILKLTRPKPLNDNQSNMFGWVMGKEVNVNEKAIKGFELAKRAKTVNELVFLINEYNLTREMLPTKFLKEAKVWEALLQNMPMTALIRNLGNMSSCGLIKSFSGASKVAINKITNRDYIRKSRLHPIAIINAFLTYKMGRGIKGSNTWSADKNVVEALEEAFYKSFDFVKPTGKNYLLGIDVSGSMGCSNIGGVADFSPAMASAVLAMATARSETYCNIVGFASHIKDLDISKHDDLETVMKKTEAHNFGSTDCAKLFTHAKINKLDIDTFVTYTDNETNAGYNSSQPSIALKAYRSAFNKYEAKAIVVGMTASNASIADPKDPLMLDIAGFSTNVPSIISSF